MADRTTNLLKTVADAQSWVGFSESAVWLKLKNLIEKEIIEPAKNAFWTTKVEDLNNEKIIRHTLSQRTTVRTALKIIDLVEGNKILLKQAQDELGKIEKAKNKKEKQNG